MDTHPLAVGDEVRLTTGWTRMIVLAIYGDGTLIAKYDNKSWPVMHCHFEHPSDAQGCQKRHESGFCAWDGKPSNRKIKPMQYRTIGNDPVFGKDPVCGTFLSRTSTGQIVLEMKNGIVIAFNPDTVEPDIPETFRVKAPTGYRCHYTLPERVSVSVGDVLVSNSGSIYTVTAINTKNESPKKLFEGHRLVRMAL